MSKVYSLARCLMSVLESWTTNAVENERAIIFAVVVELWCGWTCGEARAHPSSALAFAFAAEPSQSPWSAYFPSQLQARRRLDSTSIRNLSTTPRPADCSIERNNERDPTELNRDRLATAVSMMNRPGTVADALPSTPSSPPNTRPSIPPLPMTSCPTHAGLPSRSYYLFWTC